MQGSGAFDSEVILDFYKAIVAPPQSGRDSKASLFNDGARSAFNR